MRREADLRKFRVRLASFSCHSWTEFDEYALSVRREQNVHPDCLSRAYGSFFGFRMGGLHSLSSTCVSRKESAGRLPIVVPGSFHKGKRVKIMKNEKTAGVENVRLRDYLRKFGDCHICVEGIVDTFDVSPAKAKEVVQELVKLGLIEPVDVKDGEAPSIYSTTISWFRVGSLKKWLSENSTGSSQNEDRGVQRVGERKRS